MNAAFETKEEKKKPLKFKEIGGDILFTWNWVNNHLNAITNTPNKKHTVSHGEKKWKKQKCNANTHHSYVNRIYRYAIPL